MKPTAYVTHPIPAKIRRYLEQHCDCRVRETPGPIARSELLAGVADAEGLLNAGERVDTELLAAAPHLRVVCNATAGYDNLDIEALRRRGVTATHTPGVLDESVADLMLALMLAAARRVPELDAYVKAGHWTYIGDEALFGVDMYHATLGIIGMGRIGAAVARRARLGFGMRVLYHNRGRRPEIENALGCEYVDFNCLLDRSDFVLLLAPLTPQTRGLMGAAEFQRMKTSAIFINGARGGLVDEAALAQALTNGVIRAAGLDVYAQEPLPATSPLAHLPQAVTLPHIGSATRRTRFAMIDLAARNLIAVLTGKQALTPIPELAQTRMTTSRQQSAP